jgi:hypothetical protein
VSDDLPNLATDRRALRVYKRPIAVPVTFATADGVCDTAEGAVRFRAGDAILTGVRGERWPVRRDQFLSTYEPIAPTRNGSDGSYRKAPAVTHALRLAEPRAVTVNWQDSALQGRPGDWLLQYADGTYGVIQDAIFRETYLPAEDETRWPPPGAD